MGLDVKGLAPLLQVFDMPTSVKFYRYILGFELMAHSPPYGPEGHFHWALLTRDGVEVMLNTAYDEGERPAVPGPGRVAAHRDTGLFFGCPDVDGAHKHFVAHGLDAKRPVIQRYGMKQLYLLDPDGYSLCFQWPV